MTGPAAAVDLIEELRLRRWARENFVAPPLRDAAWHPIIHDEMQRRDQEQQGRASHEVLSVAPLPQLPFPGDWFGTGRHPLHRPSLDTTAVERHST